MIALVASARDGDRHILFCREKNEEREIWDGFRYGPDAAREIFGFDEAYSDRGARREDARPRVRPAGALHAARIVRGVGPARHRRAERGARTRAHRRVRARRGRRRARHARCDAPRQGRARSRSHAARRRDLAAPRIGARWSARGPGWYEYQVEAELVHEFLQAGALAVAYPSIVASGPNACVLHYRDNNRQMSDGELLLIDAGLRVPGLRVRHHAHVSRRRQVHGPAEGRLRARARVAARLPRAWSSRASTSTTITRPRSACSRRATSISGCARERSTACSRRGATSSSTCIAPGTGSAWTCTTPAFTR